MNPMPSPFDLRIYPGFPTFVVAVGIKNDVEVKALGDYWNLVTATANGPGFALPVHKDVVGCKPQIYKGEGLIEVCFHAALHAEEWVDEMVDAQLVEQVINAPKIGANLSAVKARTCCDSFENEIHKNPCKDYVVTRGVVHTYTPEQAEPPVAKAEPGANLCSICWNHYYGTCTGRPCGECKP